MMDQAAREKIAEVARMISAQCEEDSKSIEGKPFTGRMVAEAFGEIDANVAVLAEMVAFLALEQMPVSGG